MNNPFNTTDFANNVEFTPEEIEDGKTIKMPKEKLERWLAAMRSGEYSQGRQALYNQYSDSYCCLGLEQKVNTGEVEDDGLPTLKYLEENGIKFFDGCSVKFSRAPEIFVRGDRYAASEANDRCIPFAEIADAIEKVAVGY